MKNIELRARKLWISCPQFTAQVDVDEDGEISAAPPILKKFLGQPYQNLKCWLRRVAPSGLKIEVM
jgi:hypothetical protein